MCTLPHTMSMTAPCGRSCVAESKEQSVKRVDRNRRGKICVRGPLGQRPAHMDNRFQVGHWKYATVIGANHDQAVVMVVEWKSGCAVKAKVSSKTSALVASAIIEALKPFEARVKTLPYGNGKEFIGHAKIDETLGSTGYFARPFASCERGTNENFNGLLRQNVPKSRHMTNITDEEIKMIENKLNNRPRKRLGLRTLAEVFHQSLSPVALRPRMRLPLLTDDAFNFV